VFTNFSKTAKIPKSQYAGVCLMKRLLPLVLAAICISSCSNPLQFGLRGLPLVDPVVEVVVTQNTTADLYLTATVHVNTSTVAPMNGTFEFSWVDYPTAVSYYSFVFAPGSTETRNQPHDFVFEENQDKMQHLTIRHSWQNSTDGAYGVDETALLISFSVTVLYASRDDGSSLPVGQARSATYIERP
jgi:hypothetical protein